MPEKLNPVGILSAQSADEIDLNLESRPGKVTCVTTSQESNAAPCANCSNTRINLVRMPAGCLHWAARRCGYCDCFVGWEPKPENTVKRSRQQELINQLLESTQLSRWEREFLQGLKNKRKLSPKQQEVLAQIQTKLGGAQ